MRIRGTIVELQLQRPGLAAKDLAIATELLTRDGGVIGRLRELYVLTGTHIGLAARITAALGEIGVREGHTDNALGTGDQLQIALIPHIRCGQLVVQSQLRALPRERGGEGVSHYKSSRETSWTHSKCCGADIARMQLTTFAQLQKVSSPVPVVADVQIPIAIGRICHAPGGPTEQR